MAWHNFWNVGRGGKGNVSVLAASFDEAVSRVNEWLGEPYNTERCSCCGPNYSYSCATDEPEWDQRLIAGEFPNV